MTSLFTRWIPSLSLGVWSAILLASHFTGRAAKFLHPAFRPGVLAAGLLLALLALLIASRETPPECCADATCTHPLSRSRLGRWLTFGILVLPASFAAWLSPETFSRQAFEQRGITMDATGLGDRRPGAAASQQLSGDKPKQDTAESPAKPATETGAVEKSAGADATGAKALATATAATADNATKSETTDAVPDYLQRTKEGYIITEVLDLLYSVQDSQLRKDFEGRTVQLIAQIMPDKTSGNSTNRFKAVRMFMSCCAADARPVATLVESKTLPEFQEMTWVKVVGTATFPIENGKRTAVIQATSVEETKPPEEAMLFRRQTPKLMLPEIERLLILQDRDRRTRTLKTELKTIPADRTALEQKLATLKGQANDAKQRQRAAEVEQARLDTEIRSKREQIAKYETQKLQTRKNEEYQALNHGIDHVKGEISSIEDRQIELMETLEALKPEVAASDKAAAEAEIQVKKQISDLESKNANLQGQIAELESARPTCTEGLDEDLLDTYQRLFLTKGEAVVAVRNEVCSGCHMKITVSTFSKVKAQKSVVHCEQCNRILFPEIH